MSELDHMAAELEATGDYRVLRRVKLEGHTPQPMLDDVDRALIGICIDCETTGLDPHHDEIIEFAMLPFAFTSDGNILGVGEPFVGLREPTKSIPPEITTLTDIDAAMVEGKTIDREAVQAFVEKAVLVVAHHAAFDRPFLERFCPGFNTKAWACSQSEIDWARDGAESTKLGWLLMRDGFFHDGHRALNDCQAVLQLLSGRSPVTGQGRLEELLERARQPSFRIWAENSPFETKDVLKARGYHWSDGSKPDWPKAWYIDTRGDGQDAETEFLRAEIYRKPTQNFRIDKMTAFTRFVD